jgi:Fe2+ or Zn2+ uptake regulation protein
MAHLGPPFVVWRVHALPSGLSKADAVMAARALLDANGLQRTVARMEVLKVLLGRADPAASFTTVWLQDAMGAAGFPISPSTMYRVLEVLHRIGRLEPTGRSGAAR